MDRNCSPPPPERERPSLGTLPPECVLHVAAFLSPVEILQLSATSKYLHEVCTSTAAWRGIVQGVYAAAETENAIMPVDRAQDDDNDNGVRQESDGDVLEKAKFLVKNGRFIGWFLSSVPYSSRIILISLSPPTSSSPPYLEASQFFATNPPWSPLSVPVGAHIHPTRTSYDVPVSGPGSDTPLSGYMVDLLRPVYNLHPLFKIDHKEGALLSTGRHSSFETNVGRLKLTLVGVERDVSTTEEGEEDVEGRPFARNIRDQRNFFNLFNGVLPRRSWPTPLLVSSSAPTHRSDPTIVRSLSNWLTSRGTRAPLSPSSNRIKLHGFRLQVKRMITSLPGAFPMPAARHPVHLPRRGVGPNGGPAVLFDGQERDPELDTPVGSAVAALRAGAGLGGNGEAVMLNVPVEEEESDVGAQVRRTDDEEWFAIHPPSRPLSFASPPTTNSAGQILATSLCGMWVGTYGPHGLEFGSLSLHLTPITEDSAVGDVPISLPSHSSSGSARRHSVELRFVKLTGDQNVSSGRYSWIANLGSVDLEDGAGMEEEVVIPTVTNEELIEWSAYDPVNPNGRATPQWEKGTVQGRGQIAGAGFSSPSWTEAIVTFIRSDVEVKRDVADQQETGETKVESKVVKAVEEIRLTWPAMGMCSNFRRVRF